MWDKKVYKELTSEFKKQNKIKWNRTYKNILYWIILFFIFLPQIIIFLTRKTYEFVPDLENLPEPIQTPATWWITMKVYWENIHIDFLAKYEVSWKVIATKDYNEIIADNRIVNKIWPRDFVIWRWIMWRDENIDKFKWNEWADRTVYWYIKPEYQNWFTQTFWWKRESDPAKFNESFSNNHPIWSNKKIKLLLKKIKKWDIIRLKGYLVYVHPEKWDRHRGPSSLVRYDHWCEIIYVTNVVRLKEW